MKYFVRLNRTSLVTVQIIVNVKKGYIMIIRVSRGLKLKGAFKTLIDVG